MDFEWSDAKRRSNLIKHGIDFEDAVEVFDDICLESPDQRREYGEERIIAIGNVNGHIIVVVYTDRAPGIRRIISARRAGHEERERYRAVFARR
jgi:uncharacterized DUF497 family protein